MGTRCTTQVQKKRSGAGRSRRAAVSGAAPAARPVLQLPLSQLDANEREERKQLAEMIEG